MEWSSNDDAVATVNEDGLVTAAGNGSVRITARSGEVSAAVEITVSQAAGSITLTPDEANLTALGATVQLDAEVLDGSGQPIADAAVEWASSDEAVAAVSAEGLVTAAGNGSARITASSGEVSAAVEITVSQAAGSITLTPDEANLTALGATVQLSATVLDGSDQPIAGAACGVVEQRRSSGHGERGRPGHRRGKRKRPYYRQAPGMPPLRWRSRCRRRQAASH